MSAGTNQIKDADRVLHQVKNWIEIQRIVNPKAHRQTLASTLNNLAVCNIKDGNGTSAAAQLVNALNVNEASTPVLAHNIRQLLAMPDIATMSLTKPSRTRLSEALTNVPARAVETKMRDGWHYSLDFDLPKGGIGAENVPGIEPPVAGMELVSIGSGVVLSPGVVVTARSNITKEYFGAISVACLVDKRWDSRNVRSVIYERPKLEVAKTETLSVEGVQGVRTTFHIIDPSPGTPTSEIAALAVGNLPVKPAMIAKEEPQANDTLTLKNYSRALENLSLGIVSSQSAFRVSGTTIELADTVQGGAIGGGLFNSEGAFVGMVYDYPDNSLIRAFGIGEVSSWYRSHVKSAELTRDNGSAQSRADASVVLVLTWRRRLQDERTRELYIALTDPSKPSGQLYMIDDWCIRCKGDGNVTCPNCKGLGSVTVKGQVAAGYDFKNNPMSQLRNFQAPCPNCNGRKVFTCPSCRAGRLHIPAVEK